MSKKCRAYSESKLGLEPPDNRKSFYAGWDAALRAALAQQAEPVAGNTLLKAFLAAAKEAGVTHLRQAEADLRAAPPQRPPLSDEEIEFCRQQGYAHAGLSAPFDFGKAARAIERKVRGEEK